MAHSLLKNKIFIRNKKPLEAKILAFFNSFEGMSLSGVVRNLENVHGVKTCKASVAYWLNKIRNRISVETSKEVHELVAIDETVLKIHGRHVYIFAAIDVKNKQILAVYASRNREFHDVAMFLRKMLRVCKNKPFILVDRGPWYPFVLNRFGLTYAHMTRGLRNSIERWYRTLKERTRRFYNNFPYRDVNRGINEVQKFIELFVFWYNRLRKHESLGCCPINLKGGYVI